MQCCAAVPASGEEVGIPVSEPAHRPVPDPAHPAVEQGGLAQHRRHVPALPQHQLDNTVSLVLQLTTPHLRCGLRQGEVGLLVRTVGGRGVVDLVEFQPRGPAAQTGQPACTAQQWRISQFNA